MNFKKYYAIIVAGGKGLRLGSDIPKQFMLLNNKPILLYSIEAFSYSIYKPDLIIALSKEYQPYWLDLCKAHNITVRHSIINAGNNRSDTVRNAINYINNEHSIVAIHDGARPLINTSLIDKLYKTANETGTAVPVVDLVDAIAIKTKTKAHNIAKKDFWLVQTPQCFVGKDIKAAYNRCRDAIYDDDASLMEANGLSITRIKGERNNIKITYPNDIVIAKSLLESGDI
ncbi:MAG: IspD/TarI family cytidylyltransferase [Solitalea-like symbiont of Acarus siro]